MSKNTFEVQGDTIYIKHPEWDFIATATVREDYLDEIQSVTWTYTNGYLRSSKLNQYLHIYIMKKWYGDDLYNQMCDAGCVVDHMDNNSMNCNIENLSFLMEDENKAKGFTLDKKSKEKTFIALSMFKDFETELFQISIFFNNPASLEIDNLKAPVIVRLVYLLYDTKYEIVINDARTILNDYYTYLKFNPNKLDIVDFHIEGEVGKPISCEQYAEYMAAVMKSGHGFAQIVKKNYIKGWDRT